jgi:hypothetical protein
LPQILVVKGALLASFSTNSLGSHAQHEAKVGAETGTCMLHAS